MSLRFAFNTNGTANHRLVDAVAIVAEAGYDGIALTLDHHHLDPMSEGWERRAEAFGRDLRCRGLGSVIETGARFLLDPRSKHEPTLLSRIGREFRVAFLCRAVDIAHMLDSEAVSFWAGVLKPGVSSEQARSWLSEGLAQVCDHASRLGVTVALEPEPGMLVETVDDWSVLHHRHPGLKLALDLGHCLVTGERHPPEAVREFAPHLGTVTIEDMRRGEHVHLPFGEGEMPIRQCLESLQAVEFAGLVCVELSRDSHRADVMVRQSLDFLRGCHAGTAP